MSYKCRIYPTETQEVGFNMHCGHSRFLYNLGLDVMNCWRVDGPAGPSNYDLKAQLVELKKDQPWLRDGCSLNQQQAILDLGQAFRNWWKNPRHFDRPTFRSRHKNQSFYIAQLQNGDGKLRRLSARKAELRVPKIGWVKFTFSQPWTRIAACKSARVTKTKTDKWFVSFAAEQDPVGRTPTGEEVGIDLGVNRRITTSGGDFFDAPTTLTPAEAKRLKKLDRAIARSEKGSKRREQKLRRRARVYENQKNRRKDFTEKISTQLVRDFDLIALENLAVTKMLEKSNLSRLNRKLSDSNLGELRTRIEQKAIASGVELIKVNPAYTSQRCYACGYTSPNNRESQAVFECQQCGHADNADVNAAKNILAAGHVVTGRGRDLIEATRPIEASTSDHPFAVVKEPWCTARKPRP